MESYNIDKKAFAGAGIAVAAAFSSETEAAPMAKTAGETKVVVVTGMTEFNNGISHELCIRKIFESKRDWRLIFVRNNSAFSPKLIADADLLITCRAEGTDPIDLSAAGSGLSDKVVAGKSFWTELNINAIIDNVKNRGMGLIALHNSITAPNPKFNEFLDIAPILPHEFEPLWVTRFNKEHPITKNVGKFLISNDEQYLAMIKSTSTATLFETTAIHEKRQGVSGWALDSGKGRIAGLLPGSTIHAYQAPEYRNIFWRSAHWVMKRDIPIYPEAKNTLYD